MVIGTLLKTRMLKAIKKTTCWKPTGCILDKVGIPGLEPGMTGPESVVLPLHHIPILFTIHF
jgi:hypothetical protein